MIKKNTDFINGYIEGYYGKLLNWDNRKRILKELKKLGFNSYFYCPKEDVEHRYNWKKHYSLKWLKNFKEFCDFAKKFEINIFAGISPGLSFNFDDYKQDFELLNYKANILIEYGANSIVLMFDDIPANFHDNNPKSKSEGAAHAKLANLLQKNVKNKVLLVPRIYADELIEDNNKYLRQLKKYLNKNISIFYCGRKVVADTNYKIELKAINTASNKIIIWDNLYANDYCPKKIYISPWFKRTKNTNFLVNLTGMVETDIFLLNIISLGIKDNFDPRWKIIIRKFKIPKHFRQIEDYFFTINKKFVTDYLKNYDEQLKACDYLLWKWKSPLSREWYPFLFGLKHDLQILNLDLNKERLVKTQTNPLSYFISKKLISEELE